MRRGPRERRERVGFERVASTRVTSLPRGSAGRHEIDRAVAYSASRGSVRKRDERGELVVVDSLQ